MTRNSLAFLDEGDWFAVPLREAGYAVGVIARANPGGVLLGYFFGPARALVPSVEDLAELKAADALLVAMVSHLGLTQGKWPLIGRVRGWDRRDWPVPAFVRYEELSGRSFKVFYDDDDPNEIVREEEISPGQAEQGPKDGLLGAGYAEKTLTALLS